MGRKSRQKQANRFQAISQDVPIDIIPGLPSTVFRYFSRAYEADCLAEGKVWLSTLETCRRYEHPEQGDPDEGVFHRVWTGSTTGEPDKEFTKRAKQLGVVLGEGVAGVTFKDCVLSTTATDAYILCTTARFDPAHRAVFGNYCVRIQHSSKFFVAVTRQMSRRTRLEVARAGRVSYGSRTGLIQDDLPSRPAFTKTPQYRLQDEVRFLWAPWADTGGPFLLDCPDAARFCERIA